MVGAATRHKTHNSTQTCSKSNQAREVDIKDEKGINLELLLEYCSKIHYKKCEGQQRSNRKWGRASYPGERAGEREAQDDGGKEARVEE